MSKDRQGGGIEPRRSLTTDFTDRTMMGLQTGRRKQAWRHGKAGMYRRLQMSHYSLVKRLGLAAGVVGLLAGGAAFATAAWLRPDIRLDQAEGITTLANGDKRFWINYSSCQGQEQNGPQHEYYEMSATSHTSIEQLTQGLIGYCEADLVTQLFPDLTGTSPKKGTQDFQPYQEQYFSPYAQLKGVDSKGITVDLGLNGQSYANVHIATDKNATFYEKGQKIGVERLRVGSWLTLVVHTTALAKPYATETLPPSELAKLSENGLPIGATLEGAVQHAYNPADAIKIEETMGKDWTRLEQDKNATDGWRQVSPLQN